MQALKWTVIDQSNLSLTPLIFRFTRTQKVISNKVRHGFTQANAGQVVETEMLSGKDAAQAGFMGSSREARKRALHTRQYFRGRAESEVIVPEECPEHKRAGRADGTMGSRIRWVGSSVGW